MPFMEEALLILIVLRVQYYTSGYPQENLWTLMVGDVFNAGGNSVSLHTWKWPVPAFVGDDYYCESYLATVYNNTIVRHIILNQPKLSKINTIT